MNLRILLLMQFLLSANVNLISLCIAWQREQHKRWSNRQWLVRPFNQRRTSRGYFANTFQELKSDDPHLFFRVTRMHVETFNHLSRNLSPYLTKRRSNICAEQRLAITLRYLSTGDSILSIAVEFRTGESTCYKIIKETCEVIFAKLSPVYLKVPTEEEWKNISMGYLKEWNLPNCCGAIDGKHVVIKAPEDSGSLFHNYKNTFSIILLAVCNHKYEFTLFDVGAVGSESDGGVLHRSEMGRALREGNLNLPTHTNPLPGSDIRIPYFFVGDEAFGLAPNIMRPYPGRLLEEKKTICNYRLSRARRIIENSFGILVARWRFLTKPIGFHPDVVVKCVLAAICLHNYLMSSSNKTRDTYCPAGFIDVDEVSNGQWRQDVADDDMVQNIEEVNSQNEVFEEYAIRRTLTDYFLTDSGEVPWHKEYVNRGSFQNV